MNDFETRVIAVFEELQYEKLKNVWVARLIASGVDNRVVRLWVTEVGHVLDVMQSSVRDLLELVDRSLASSDPEHLTREFRAWLTATKDITLIKMARSLADLLRIDPLNVGINEIFADDFEGETIRAPQRLETRLGAASALCRRGDYAYQRGDLIEARAKYDTAFAVASIQYENEAMMNALIGLAYVAHDLGDHDEAFRLIDALFKLVADSPNVQDRAVVLAWKVWAHAIGCDV